MDTSNQLIGMRGALIFATVAAVGFLAVNLYLRNETHRRKIHEWRISDSRSAKAFRYAVLTLIFLTSAHIVVTVVRLFTEK